MALRARIAAVRLVLLLDIHDCRSLLVLRSVHRVFVAPQVLMIHLEVVVALLSLRLVHNPRVVVVGSLVRALLTGLSGGLRLVRAQGPGRLLFVVVVETVFPLRCITRFAINEVVVLCHSPVANWPSSLGRNLEGVDVFFEDWDLFCDWLDLLRTLVCDGAPLSRLFLLLFDLSREALVVDCFWPACSAAPCRPVHQRLIYFLRDIRWRLDVFVRPNERLVDAADKDAWIQLGDLELLVWRVLEEDEPERN